MSADMGRRPRAGAVWLFEGCSDHMEPIERPIYLVPGTRYGLTAQQVLDLPIDRQVEVFESWAKANFEPGPPEVQMNLGAEPIFRIDERIDLEFHDARTGGHGPAIRETAQRLGVPVWIQRSEDRETLRREALHRLDAFEAVLRRAQRPDALMGHNKPPEPIDDYPISSYDYNDALNAITETRKELTAERPDSLILRNSAQRFLKVGLDVIGWLARKGDIAADEFMKAIGKTTGAAVGAAVSVAVVTLSQHLSQLGQELAHTALQLVEVLQRLVGP